MKKVYQSDKWKRYSQKKSEKIIKKRQKLNAKKSAKIREFSENYKKKKISRYQDQRKKRKKITIKAPSNFSIVNNTNEMLSFFNDYYHYVREDKRIFFDMSEVSEMTEDAILYMLSRFNYSEKFLGHQYVSGNVPSNLKCQELLMESGFYDHVYYRGNKKAPSGKIFSIKTKQLVYGETAKEVIEFAKNYLNKNNGNQLKGIYPILIECMANTRNHAYDRLTNPIARWWLVAMYNEKDISVHFTFLDNGFGIPRTIRKKPLEKLAGIFRGLKDTELISSALEGEFRTKTGFKWRGKGLPKIRSYVINGAIKNMQIISNNGYVFCEKDDMQTQELENRFYGTLLSWDIS